MKRLTLISILFLFIASCNKGKNNSDSCNGGSTRRDIKLVIDTESSDIDTIAVVSTVDSLGGIDLMEADKNTSRQEIEKMVFAVTAKVEKLSKHRDGDYKIKLVSEDENYLNCESPNIGCSYASGSPFYDKLKKVREFIEEHEDDLEGKTVTITGIGFIDIEHNYPRNAAANDFELHPILDISF